MVEDQRLIPTHPSAPNHPPPTHHSWTIPCCQPIQAVQQMSHMHPHWVNTLTVCCSCPPASLLCLCFLQDNVVLGDNVTASHALLCAGATVHSGAGMQPGVVLSYPSLCALMLASIPSRQPIRCLVSLGLHPAKALTAVCGPRRCVDFCVLCHSSR
jgi:hypothetical protein